MSAASPACGDPDAPKAAAPVTLGAYARAWLADHKRKRTG